MMFRTSALFMVLSTATGLQQTAAQGATCTEGAAGCFTEFVHAGDADGKCNADKADGDDYKILLNVDGKCNRVDEGSDLYYQVWCTADDAGLVGKANCDDDTCSNCTITDLNALKIDGTCGTYPYGDDGTDVDLTLTGTCNTFDCTQSMFATEAEAVKCATDGKAHQMGDQWMSGAMHMGGSESEETNDDCTQSMFATEAEAVKCATDGKAHQMGDQWMSGAMHMRADVMSAPASLTLSVPLDVDLSSLDSTELTAVKAGLLAIAAAAGGFSAADVEKIVLMQDGKVIGGRHRRAENGPITVNVIFKENASVDLDAVKASVNKIIESGSLTVQVMVDGKSISATVTELAVTEAAVEAQTGLGSSGTVNVAAAGIAFIVAGMCMAL
jgi:hypothetical protein